MKRKRNPRKVRDIVIGFLGWAIFDNLYILLGLSLGFLIPFVQAAGFFLALVSPLVIVSLILLWQKQKWMGIGVVIAVLVNFGVWAILYGLDLGPWFYYLLMPFPAGINFLL